MATTKGLSDNANGVYAGGPRQIDEFKAAGTITPGSLVKSDTTDGSIVVAGSGDNNVIGYAMENYIANKAFRDDFVTSDFVPVCISPGSRFMAILDSANSSLVTGDLLKCSGSGKVDKWTAAAAGDSRKALCRYIGKADVAGSAGGRILVELL